MIFAGLYKDRAGEGDIGGDERNRIRRADMGDSEHEANGDTLAMHDYLLQRMDIFQFFHITFLGLSCRGEVARSPMTGNIIS